MENDRDTRFRSLLPWLAAGLLMAAAAGVFLLLNPDLAAGLPAKLEAGRQAVTDGCRQYPVVLFLALLILPAFGFPASPLLILAGASWGTNLTSCLIAIGAMAGNMSLGYFLAAGPGRGLITRFLGDRITPWRNISQKDQARLTAMLRLAPGLPLCVQNYILGLLGIPFGIYLLVSVPLNSIFVFGFVLTGGAIFEGHFGKALIGVAAVLAATLVIRLVRGRLRASSQSPG